MHGALEGSLDDVSVVALVTNIPGPIAAARLRALGASVVKIEPRAGDGLESTAPDWYREIVRNMTVRRFDLSEGPARFALDKLLESTDVVLTSMRASSLERVDFSWAKLHARFPRLIHVAICGEAPPNDDRSGHDLTYQARAGTISPPDMPRALVGDMAAAERAVSAVLAALRVRERTGTSTRVDVAIVDAATDFAAPFRHGLTSPTGVLGGARATYRIYSAAQGYVALAALEPHFVRRLQTMLECESYDAASLTREFARRSAREWEILADECDVPLAAVRDGSSCR